MIRLVLQDENTTGLDALGRLWIEDLWARVLANLPSLVSTTHDTLALDRSPAV